MILTVTPNPALDLTWHVDRLIEGGTHRADAGAARAGGKALNVARVAHAQGAAVLAVMLPDLAAVLAGVLSFAVPGQCLPVAAAGLHSTEGFPKRCELGFS